MSGREDGDALQRQRIIRAKRKLMLTLQRFPALEYHYRYPMLRDALQVHTPAEWRASAALLYAQQILREAGLIEAADRIRQIRIDDRKRGAPTTLWIVRNQKLLLRSLAEIFSNQSNISVSAACRYLAAREPWLAEGITEAAIRNEFCRRAKQIGMKPKILAQSLAEDEAVSRNEQCSKNPTAIS